MKYTGLPWDTEETRNKGLREWLNDISRHDYMPLGYVWPKDINPQMFKFFQEHNRTYKLKLYHGSTEIYPSLEPKHDYYGLREFAAISCTTDPNYALAFGLINPNIKTTNQVILYKLNEEAIEAVRQIGTKCPKNAYDVLHSVTDFEYHIYEVINYEFDRDHCWIFKTLLGEIDTIKYEELVSRIHHYLKEK